MPPYDPERPQVDLFDLGFCNPALQNFPTTYSVSISSDAMTLHSSVRSNSVGYAADSGSIHTEPLGGGYARIDVDLWYRAVGSALPRTFQIAGQIVAR
jgi:hypothetical protein